MVKQMKGIIKISKLNGFVGLELKTAKRVL